jgi:DNA-binding LacI/PurR family transcriptional regulator
MQGEAPPARLAQVADRAGVSLATASLALRRSPRVAEGTRMRIEAAARALDYQPLHAPERRLIPRALHREAAIHVGVVGAVGFEELLTDPFQVTVMTGFLETLEHSHATATFLPPPDVSRNVALLASAPMDGLVLVHSPAALGAALAVVERRALPAISLDPRPGDAIPGVMWLDFDGMSHLVSRIVAQGHKEALVVTLPFGGGRRRRGFVPIPAQADVPSQAVRQRLQAIHEAELTVSAVYETEASSLAEGERAGEAIVMLAELPTLIACQSDVLAAGVLTALERHGIRVPHDVSVTGFDGLDLPLIAPHVLTSVLQDGYEKGRRAAHHMLALIAGQRPEPSDMKTAVRDGNTLGRPRVGSGRGAAVAAEGKQ